MNELINLNTATDRLKWAVRSRDTVQGLTHNFYRYPARFSPRFAREAIELFSKPGDIVLDPFVGGGTTMVEALAIGRHAIGWDVSPIATFVSRVKTMVLSEKQVYSILEWARSVLTKRIAGYEPTITYYDEAGYLNHLPWRIKACIEVILNEVGTLPSVDAQDYVKCVVLKTAQWAIDCRKSFPSASHFRAKLSENFSSFLRATRELNQKVMSYGTNQPYRICMNQSAEHITSSPFVKSLRTKPKLVVTSPPYVGVHMLYHQWQVNSRRRTRVPFWIINDLDGHGSGHYTFGHYKSHSRLTYYDTAQRIFSSVHEVLAEDGLVVQLVGFSDPGSHLPRYLDMMRDSGFREVVIKRDSIQRISRIWRSVPNRKWYADSNSRTSSGKEVLLIHKKT